MFIVAFFAMLTAKDRQAIPRDWRINVFYILWFYFLLTSLNALSPGGLAKTD